MREQVSGSISAQLSEPMSGAVGEQTSMAVVLDTNIVLDLFLFADPRTAPLRAALQAGQLQWWTAPRMRDELERVLAYPHIVALLSARGKAAHEVLRDFDDDAHLHTKPMQAAPYRCQDPDDQIFIDLACTLAQGAAGKPVLLLSKDRAVLKMRKRLERLSILVKLTICA